MRTLIWYAHFAISLFFTLPSLFFVSKQKDKLPPEEFFKKTHKFTSKWAKRQLDVSGIRLHTKGLENIPENKTVLYVSNHQGNFDIPLIMCCIDIPKGFIAKKELLKIPVLRTWMEYINCVFMDRTDIKKSAQAILDGIKILKSGHSMVVFPEGTRSKSNTLGEFKAGSFKLATKAKVAIVPITISGSYRLMESNGNKIKPADVYVTIHPIVETENLTVEEAQALPENIKNIIASGLEQLED